MSLLQTVEDYIDAGLTHEIHTSERMSRRGCRRRHAWVFRDGYYPKITAKPLEFGVAYHKGMETLYDPANWIDGDYDTAYALARKVFKDTCETQKQTFIGNFPNDYSSEVDLDYKERVELGLGMLDFWYKEVMPKYDQGFFTPVRTEISFEVPIKSPTGRMIWCKCDRCWNRFIVAPKGIQLWKMSMSGFDDLTPPDAAYYRKHMWPGLPVTYGGRIDLLVEDTNGDYWIVDWKTTSRMTNAEAGAADEFLLLDDQITSYCWALWSLGISVKGFIYVEIKKGFPQEPEPNKVQRLGRWFSVAKQQVTTYEVYKRTVAENDTQAYEAGLYDEFLDWLKVNAGLEAFVHRHQVVRNEAELLNAGLNIYHEAKEIVDHDMALYPSPGRFACNFCAFRDPCIAKNRNEDFQYALETLYDKREYHYWQTAPSNTDKRYDG